MKTLFGATMVAILVGCLAVPMTALGQQKTVKECRDEWRASTDAAKGTQKDYVAKCRSGNTVATPTGTPTPPPTAAPAPKAAAPVAAPPTSAKAKTAKECRDEWRANKDANKSAGVTEKDYVAKCRAGGAAPAATAPTAPAPGAAAPAAPAPAGTAPAPAPTAAAPAKPTPAVPAPPPAPAAAAPAKTTPVAPAPTGANQYSTEAQAKARCPSDAVVWVNLDSKIYHFSGYRNYGKTKEGAYMCEKDAMGAAFNAAKNEKHP
jgi:hypothetical protein